MSEGRLPVSGKVIIIGVALMVLLGAILLIWKPWSVEKTVYREVSPHRGEIRLTLLSTGTVQPQNRLEIKPPIAGRVEEVLVKEGQRVRKGQVLAWMSSTERAALLDSARSQGPEELKRWEGIYRPTPVIAPLNGTIILRNIEAGQTFNNTDAILVMSDRLTVKAQVDETDIAEIKLKQKAEVVLDAYAGEKLPATVDQIAFEAKAVNNVTNYVVDVLPASPPETMRSGMTANVTFVIQEKPDVLLILAEAIRTNSADGKTSVLLKGAKGKPVEQNVELGISDGKNYEVLSGLTEKDVVLVTPFGGVGAAKTGAASPFGMPNIRGNRRGR